MANALVRWKSGNDKGLFTVLSTDWIIGFDTREFMQLSNREKSYMIEWREGVTKPVNGWQVYKGVVLEISDSKMELYSILELWTEHNSGTHGQYQADNGRLKNDDAVQDKIEVIAIINENRRLKLECALLKEENCRLKRKRDQTPPKIDKKVSSWLPRMDPFLLPRLSAYMNNLSASLPETEQSDDPLSPAKSTMVELFENTGVMIDADALESAKCLPCGTSFASRLLGHLFPKEVLLISNYKGGKSTTTNGPLRPALDKVIMGALFDAAYSHDPGMKRVEFGIAINGKLNHIRMTSAKAYRNKNKKLRSSF